MAGQGQEAFHISQGDLPAFIEHTYRDGLEAAKAKWSVESQASSLAGTKLRDPRNWGSKGAYPRMGKTRSAAKLERFYEENGIYAAIVDQWAEDTFADGFTITAEDEAWADQVNALLDELNIWAAFEEADRDVVQHGRGVLYLRLTDASGDPTKEPSAVRGVDEVAVVPPTSVGKGARVDEPGPDWGTLATVELNVEGRKVPVHADRILVLREFPNRTDPLKGIARLTRCQDVVVAMDNFLWATFESFWQRAAPLLQVRADPDAVMQKGTRNEVDAQVDKLQSGIIQKVMADGWRIETVSGSSGIVSPKAYEDVAWSMLAATSRIPVHILKGSAAGELASSLEDTRRFRGRVARRRSKYGEPAIKVLVQRFADWGLIGDVPASWSIQWPSLDDPTVEETAATEKARADTLIVYKDNGLKPPAYLVDYDAGSFEDILDDEKPEPAPAPADPGDDPERRPLPPDDNTEPPPGPVPGLGHREALPPEDRIEVPELKRLRQRSQQELTGAFLDWQDAYLAAFDGRVDAVPEAKETDPDDPALQALQKVRLKPGPVVKVLRHLLTESAQLGGRLAMKRLGRTSPAREDHEPGHDPEDLFHFIDDTPARTFAVLSQSTGEQISESMTTRVRREIAEGVARGEPLRLLRNRVLGVFDSSPAEAERIARTESMRGLNYGNREALRQVGAQEYEFVAFNEACTVCAPLDGERFAIEDHDHVPPMHPNCRCTIILPGD